MNIKLQKPESCGSRLLVVAASNGKRKALDELGKGLRRQALAEVATLQFTMGWDHSLPGTAWWATRVLSSPHGMSIATAQGVFTSAPQRETVTLEQAIVVATVGPHIPRSISA
jgi:hypothetical protein